MASIYDSPSEESMSISTVCSGCDNTVRKFNSWWITLKIVSLSLNEERKVLIFS